MLRKMMTMAAILTLAPLAGMATSSPAEAHTGVAVSGSIVINTPGAVLGFSYGNPYLAGPVYADPLQCTRGPLYYYPAYHVYGVYSPRYVYYDYYRPVVRHTHGYYARAYNRHHYRQVYRSSPARRSVRGHAVSRRGYSNQRGRDYERGRDSRRENRSGNGRHRGSNIRGRRSHN